MRTLIIASDPLSRAGLAALLAPQSNITIVGQISPTDDLAAALVVFRPDVILWDVSWSLAQSVEVLSNFAEAAPAIVAVVSDDAMFSPVWATGVRGVLSRSLASPQIAAALIAVGYGLRVSDHALLRTSPRFSAEGREQGIEPLTEREVEVLQKLAEGLPNKQIARAMMISEHTVKFHVNAILGKLQAQSRTEAVVRATRAGLILL